MTAPGEHEDWARRAKDCFDESVERLDAPALSRLNRARHEALTARPHTPAHAWRRYLPVTGLIAALAMVALLVGGPESGLPPLPETVNSDVDLLLVEYNLEMIEDLEFYYWMDELSAGKDHDAG